jgi:hypothetical protein
MSSRDRRNSSPRGSRTRARSSPRGDRGSSLRRTSPRSSPRCDREDRRPSPRDRRESSPGRRCSSGDRHRSSGDRYRSSGDRHRSTGDRHRSSGGGRTPPRIEDLTQSEGSERKDDDETLPPSRVRHSEKTTDSQTSWFRRRFSHFGYRRSSNHSKNRDRDRDRGSDRYYNESKEEIWQVDRYDSDDRKEFVDKYDSNSNTRMEPTDRYNEQNSRWSKERVERYREAISISTMETSDHYSKRRSQESNDRYREPSSKRSHRSDRYRRSKDIRRTPTPPLRGKCSQRQSSPRPDKYYDAPLDNDLNEAFEVEKLRKNPWEIRQSSNERYQDRDNSRSSRRRKMSNDQDYSNSRSHRTERGLDRPDRECLEISLSNRSGTNHTTKSTQTNASVSDDSTAEYSESTSTFQTEDSSLVNVRITAAHLKQEPPNHKLVRPELEPRPTELRSDFKSARDYLDLRNNKLLSALLDSINVGRKKEKVIFSDECHTINYNKTDILYSKDRAIILTNKSLYLFPPLLYVESKSYIIANDYERFNIANIARISMPYRTEVDRETKEEVAKRTNEAAVHMLRGHTIWVSMANGKRQEFVETLNDVYQNRLGCPVLMSRDDYRELLDSITKASLWLTLAWKTIKAWATGAQILKSGKLLYQERKGARNIISKVWRKKWVCLFVHALIILDSHEDLEFLRRGEYSSSSFREEDHGKYRIIRLRGCVLQRNTKKRMEWRVVENPRKNILVASRRCGEFQADSPQDSSLWVEAINLRKAISVSKCVSV